MVMAESEENGYDLSKYRKRVINQYNNQSDDDNDDN